MFTCRLQVNISCIDSKVFYVVCIIFFTFLTLLSLHDQRRWDHFDPLKMCALLNPISGAAQLLEGRKCSPVGYRLIVRSSIQKCSTWSVSVLRKENTKVKKMSVKVPCHVSRTACTAPLPTRAMLCMNARVGNA